MATDTLTAIYLTSANLDTPKAICKFQRALNDVAAQHGYALKFRVVPPHPLLKPTPPVAALSTSCPPPRAGGMCGCDEDDDGPVNCTKLNCSC